MERHKVSRVAQSECQEQTIVSMDINKPSLFNKTHFSGVASMSQNIYSAIYLVFHFFTPFIEQASFY